MTVAYIHGIGEMLRYLTELFDSGSEKTYPELTVHYRPRYTPVMRAIVAGATTVSEITSVTFLTQGAVSQTVSLMEKDGLLRREALPDARKNALRLTPLGRSVQRDLEVHWQSIFLAVDRLEKETGLPIMKTLEQTIKALDERSAEGRIEEAKADILKGEQRNDEHDT